MYAFDTVLIAAGNPNRRECLTVVCSGEDIVTLIIQLIVVMLFNFVI